MLGPMGIPLPPFGPAQDVLEHLLQKRKLSNSRTGIYFHWKTKTLELAGYVRLHGELSVLGLISASLTFNLQLGYLKENGRSLVYGEASIEVEIESCFSVSACR
jgi:hypothetical protein